MNEVEIMRLQRSLEACKREKQRLQFLVNSHERSLYINDCTIRNLQAEVEGLRRALKREATE